MSAKYQYDALKWEKTRIDELLMRYDALIERYKDPSSLATNSAKGVLDGAGKMLESIEKMLPDLENADLMPKAVRASYAYSLESRKRMLSNLMDKQQSLVKARLQQLHAEALYY